MNQSEGGETATEEEGHRVGGGSRKRIEVDEDEEGKKGADRNKLEDEGYKAGREVERKGDERSGEREVRSKMARHRDKELINGVGL